MSEREKPSFVQPQEIPTQVKVKPENECQLTGETKVVFQGSLSPRELIKYFEGETIPDDTRIDYEIYQDGDGNMQALSIIHSVEDDYASISFWTVDLTTSVEGTVEEVVNTWKKLDLIARELPPSDD